MYLSVSPGLLRCLSRKISGSSPLYNSRKTCPVPNEYFSLGFSAFPGPIFRIFFCFCSKRVNTPAVCSKLKMPATAGPSLPGIPAPIRCRYLSAICFRPFSRSLPKMDLLPYRQSHPLRRLLPFGHRWMQHFPCRLHPFGRQFWVSHL